MSPLAGKLLREAFFTRDHSCCITAGLLSPDSRAAQELVQAGLVIEAGRKVDNRGRIGVTYKLTSKGQEQARTIAVVATGHIGTIPRPAT